MRKTALGLLIGCLCVVTYPLSIRAKSEEDYQQEIRSLQKRNTQLENKLEQSAADLKNSLTQINILKAQLLDITDHQEESAKEVKESRSAIKQLKSQIENLLEQQASNEEMEKALRQIRELQNDLRQANKDKTTLEQKVEALTKKTSKTDDPALQAEIDRLRAELDKQRHQFKANLALLHDRERELEQARASATPSDGRLTELETMLASANAKLIKLSQKNTQLEAQLQNTPQKADPSQDAEIARLEGELRKAADYINARNAEISALSQEKTRLSAQLAELQQRSATLTSERQETERIRQKMAEMDAQVSQAAQENLTLQAQVDTLHDQLITQGSVPDEARKRIQELTLELQNTRTQLKDQQTMEQEYPKLQREVESLQQQLALFDQEREHGRTLEEQLQDQEQTLQQARKELDAVASQNLEVTKELKDKEERYRSQARQYQEVTARNRELETQYQEGLKDLALKEQLLQKVITEKSVLEKVIDEEGSPFDKLNAKIEDLEAQKAVLQKQIKELHASQIVKLNQQRPSPPSSDLASLQHRLLQEQTLRQQTEANLQEALKQAQVFQQQVAALKTRLLSTSTSERPAAAAPSQSAELSDILFPRSLLQQASQGTITLLDWSPDRTKLAYLETTPQQARLRIFHVQTQRAVTLTAWQPLSASQPGDARFAWAYDNEHFLFAVGSPGRYALYLGNSRQLIGKPISLQEPDVCIAWAPNQLRYAYFSGSMLVVKHVRGESLPLQIGHQSDAVGTSLAWSPDGTRIAFSSKRGASVDIFTLLLTQKAPLLQTLVASSSDDVHPSWSPDGRNIAFYVRSKQYDTKLAVVPVDRSRAPYIVAHKVSSAQDKGPTWKTSTQILYLGDEHTATSENAIYSVNISTGQRSAAALSILLD